MRTQLTPCEPLTYAHWVGFVLDHHIRTNRVPTVRVQVRKRGVMFCGRVLEASPARLDGERDWFKVDCYLGELWFVDTNVRLCSGDGRCICEAPEATAGERSEHGGAFGAVPPGNTGTTLGVKA